MNRVAYVAGAASLSLLAALMACTGPDDSASAGGSSGGGADAADAGPEGATGDGGVADGSHSDATSAGDADAAPIADAGPEAATGDADADATPVVDAGPDFPPQNANDPRVQQLIAYARAQLTSASVPGLAFAVVVGGKLFYAGGVGVKKLGGSDPVDSHTLFRAASMSKMVAAATVESLVQDGSIDTSHPITDYTNGLVLSAPFQSTSILIEHLLSHTSGLPDTAPIGCVQPTLADWFSTSRPLWSTPGTIWDYSNTGFAALGMVVESVTGQAYPEVVQSRVFGPAGMTSATFDATAAMALDHSNGMVLGSGGSMNVVDLNQVHCVFDGPPGGVIATVVDYAHFVETMLASGGAMLHADRVAAMETPYISTHDAPTRTYDFGLIQQEWVPGEELFWHMGDLPGYHSELGWLPVDDVGVVVMTNGDPTTGDAADAVMVEGLTLFARAPAPSQWTTPQSDWVAYPGTYVDPYGQLGTVTVTLTGGTTLGATSTGLALSGTLQQIATDKWWLPGTALEGTFWRDGGATPGFFVTRVGVGVRQ